MKLKSTLYKLHSKVKYPNIFNVIYHLMNVFVCDINLNLFSILLLNPTIEICIIY